MRRKVLYSVGLVAMFVFGYGAAQLSDAVARAQAGAAPEKAAYLIASSNSLPLAPEKRAAYGKAAGPLARQAGMQLLGVGQGKTVHVLEGKWPYEGRVAVEKFRSMKALLDFWNSPAYQEAKTLRNEANFIIAVEAVE